MSDDRSYQPPPLEKDKDYTEIEDGNGNLVVVHKDDAHLGWEAIQQEQDNWKRWAAQKETLTAEKLHNDKICKKPKSAAHRAVERAEKTEQKARKAEHAAKLHGLTAIREAEAKQAAAIAREAARQFFKPISSRQKQKQKSPSAPAAAAAAAAIDPSETTQTRAVATAAAAAAVAPAAAESGTASAVSASASTTSVSGAKRRFSTSHEAPKKKFRSDSLFRLGVYNSGGTGARVAVPSAPGEVEGSNSKGNGSGGGGGDIGETDFESFFLKEGLVTKNDYPNMDVNPTGRRGKKYRRRGPPDVTFVHATLSRDGSTVTMISGDGSRSCVVPTENKKTDESDGPGTVDGTKTTHTDGVAAVDERQNVTSVNSVKRQEGKEEEESGKEKRVDHLEAEYIWRLSHWRIRNRTDIDPATTRPISWIFDVATCKTYCPEITTECGVSPAEFKSIMMRLLPVHRNGRTLSDLPIEQLKSMASRICREYQLPNGFDKSEFFLPGSDRAWNETPEQRTERVLVCFLYGLMDRKIPRTGPLKGRSYHRNPALSPLLTLSCSEIPVFFGYLEAAARHTHVSYIKWRRALVDDFLGPDERMNLRHTCRTLHEMASHPMRYGLIALSYYLLPGAVLPVVADQLATRCHDRLHEQGLQLKALLRKQITQEKRLACARDAYFATHGAMLNDGRLHSICLSNRELFAAALIAYISASRCMRQFESFKVVTAGGTKVPTIVEQFSSFLESVEPVAGCQARYDYDKKGTRVVVTTTHTKDSDAPHFLRPILVVSRFGIGRRSRAEVFSEKLQPYTVWFDVTRGIAWTVEPVHDAAPQAVLARILALVEGDNHSDLSRLCEVRSTWDGFNKHKAVVAAFDQRPTEKELAAYTAATSARIVSQPVQSFTWSARQDFWADRYSRSLGSDGSNESQDAFSWSRANVF